MSHHVCKTRVYVLVDDDYLGFFCETGRSVKCFISAEFGCVALTTVHHETLRSRPLPKFCRYS